MEAEISCAAGVARPIAVDLFAGAGGMSLGFEQAGFDVVAAVEYDPVHAATHAFNFPATEVLCRDVAFLDAKTVLEAARRGYARMYPEREWPGRIDAIIGGPPCQGFSTGGKREDGDERNGLLLAFVNLVRDLKPSVLCLENVAGLLERRFDEVRDEAFRRLTAAGYALSGTTAAVDCSDFGVPQRRRRVIVLGRLGGLAPDRPTPLSERLSVADALDGLPSPGDYPALRSSDVTTLTESDAEKRTHARSAYARQLGGVEPIPGDVGFDHPVDPAVITGARFTVHTAVTTERFSKTEQGTVEPKSHLYRLRAGGPARTLRAGTGAERGAHTSPRPIHPTEARVITVREAARLHGYPDWFRFHTTNWHGHRQVGNSVPPPMARAAATSLLASLGVKPVQPDRCFIAPVDDLLSLSRTAAKTRFDVIESELPRGRTRPEERVDVTETYEAQ